MALMYLPTRPGHV